MAREITAQSVLFMNENSELLVTLADITANNSPTIFEAAASGTNFTTDVPSGSTDTFTVIPTANFFGKLSIPVRVGTVGPVYGPWANLFVNVVKVGGGANAFTDQDAALRLHSQKSLIDNDNNISGKPTSLRTGKAFHSRLNLKDELDANK